jgi:hypothetical protein
MITAEIVALKQKEQELRERYRSLGMINTSGRTLEEIVKLDIDYKVAEKAWVEANNEYHEAIKKIGNNNAE